MSPRIDPIDRSHFAGSIGNIEIVVTGGGRMAGDPTFIGTFGDPSGQLHDLRILVEIAIRQIFDPEPVIVALVETASRRT